MQRFNPLKPQNEGKKPHPKPLPKGTIPSPEPVGSAPNLIENNEKDGLELHFLKRPGPDVLEKFHATKELPLNSAGISTGKASSGTPRGMRQPGSLPPLSLPIRPPPVSDSLK